MKVGVLPGAFHNFCGDKSGRGGERRDGGCKMCETLIPLSILVLHLPTYTFYV